LIKKEREFLEEEPQCLNKIIKTTDLF